MNDYEKLGVFYLGRRFDPEAGLTDELVLYDSSDLTTHAVIIGMTGSGKTGLGVTLIEEAALDRVPVIAIDPKGDLGNLLLTFPALAAADFEPWVDAQDARNAGRSVEDHAAAEASRWRAGLESWGQPPERIERLRAAAEFALYTPGSSAGLGISILSSFGPPAQAMLDDADLYREHLQSLVTGLLSLIGEASDPVTGRAHVLLSALFDEAWHAGRPLELPALIAAIGSPPFQTIGVMDLETFYPAKDRLALAMRLNALLASAGFEAWTRGDPLDAAALLHTANGHPRVSVLSIAHLGEAERMFFVTMLLNEIIAWMRAQPGTSSLRAILYMDEVAGYLPPVAAPASKTLFLTLLKQARAYGLGVVLSTQNPVDLDYKALSNAGTWFIGRLQTEQDRNRVRDGLLQAASAGRLPAAELDATLGKLGKRTFLLQNVHESAPVILQSRWAMSYLRGPLTREDIRRLTGETAATRAVAGDDASVGFPAGTGDVSPPLAPRAQPAARADAGAPPVAGPSINVRYVRPQLPPAAGERLVYEARLVGAAHVVYLQPRYGVEVRRDPVVGIDLVNGAIDWSTAEPLDIAPGQLADRPEPGSAFDEPPAGLYDALALKRLEKQFLRWLRIEHPVRILRSRALGVSSGADEDAGAFRARRQLIAREQRDRKVAALRQKYAARYAALEERLRHAEQAGAREREQATGSGVDAAVSVGAAVLGALLGRKSLSATRVSSAVRKASAMRRQSGDVQRADETIIKLRADLAALDARAKADVDALESQWDAEAESLEEIAVHPKAADVGITYFGVVWIPLLEDANGKRRSA